MDIKSKLNITYFIAFRDLISNKATFISIELANKVSSHLLIAVDILETAIIALNTDPFAYSTNTKL